MPMNKKTFTVAVIFLIVTLVWLGVNIIRGLSKVRTAIDAVALGDLDQTVTGRA